MTDLALRRGLGRWTTWTPAFAFVVLLPSWGRHLPPIIMALEAALLIGAVMAAVYHAEVIAHRIGEPFGSLVLAVAVTVIEVGLIVTLMVSSKGDTSTLARDTVFAVAMITMNGIVGLSILVAAIKYHLAVFHPEGTGSALGTVIALAALCLILPQFTTSQPGPTFNGKQLAFAAVASAALYGMFVFTQTIRHRDFFLPPTNATGNTDDDGPHAIRPSSRRTLASLVLLPVSLVAVVGLSKVESPAIEAGVDWLGFPHSFVGVVLAFVVLLPESIAAVKAAAQNRTQISLNLAYGSAIASIGLTIPTLAVASIWLPGTLTLGLGPTHITLLVTSAVVSVLTVVPGRAKSLHATLHLTLLATFLFLSVVP
ncbi:MAG: ionic transporter y4hA [Micrococcales bacterium]|nr:ionic transporter y4hA [Micrococcales bacterium]